MRNCFSHRGELWLPLSLTLAAGAAMAGDFTKGPLTISSPWIRATPAGAPVAGGYLTLINKGSEADRLVGGSVDFAGKVEIHEMAMANGVMTMRALPAGLELKPGASVELKPGSFHIMFMNLKRPLKQGESASGSLTFEKAGTIPVQFTIESMGAQSAPMPSH